MPFRPEQFKAIPVTLSDGRQINAYPQQFRVKASDDLDIIVEEPATGFAAMSLSDWIDLGIAIYDKLKGGGGGGGGGVKCTQKITSTTQPDGTITTTIETTCAPA